MKREIASHRVHRVLLVAVATGAPEAAVFDCGGPDRD